MGRRSKLVEKVWDHLAFLYENADVSLKDIATAQDVHLETIRKGFIKRGVKLRPPHKTIGPTGRKPKYRD
jgi:hypothetical protein